MNVSKHLIALCVFAACSQSAMADDWKITYEKPGVQNTTANLKISGVQTFDKQDTGSGQSFNSKFGSGGIQGKYSSVQIASADQYGGAGGEGNYAVAFPNTPYELKLTKTPGDKGVNYFGYWLSALDPGNTVTFYKEDKQVGVFDSKSFADISGVKAYAGNPNAGWMKGKNDGEAYAFVNFYDTTGRFDRIVFSEAKTYGGGYETDNHTVGIFNAPVPEPETWALMLAGLAFMGLKIRRK